jgi:hypothetical protein
LEQRKPQVEVKQEGKLLIASCQRCGGFIAAAQQMKVLAAAQRHHQCPDQERPASPSRV